jgi:hypothetical protein
MTNPADTIFPKNVLPTGQANHQPAPVGPEFGHNNTSPLPAPGPAYGHAEYQNTSETAAATAPTTHNSNPRNVNAPFAQPNKTAILSPIGVQPRFKTPTIDITLNYGNGG